MKTLIKDILVRLYPIYYNFLVWRLRHKKTINVVFFASSISMWRYQHLYELLSKNQRFNANIIIHPAFAYSADQQKADVDALIEFFENKNTPYSLAVTSEGKFIDIRKEFSPDILFYPQPFNNFYSEDIS